MKFGSFSFFLFLFLHIIVRSGFKMQCQVLSLLKCSRHVTQPLHLSRPLREVSKYNSSSFAAGGGEKLIYSIPSISRRRQMSPAGWEQHRGSLSCTPTPWLFLDLSFRRDGEKFGLDVKRAVPGSGKPGAAAALGKFRFPASAVGFRSCHGSRGPAGWLVTGAGFHPFKRLQI